MSAASNNPKGIGGVSNKVGKEFLKKTPEKKKSMFARLKGE